jgi:enoyl-CoA hydratase/carnithine racemase
MADEVLTARDGAVLTITLNRPDTYNAINRAVPEAELDAVVDDWVEKLARKLPQTTRYAKQQLDFWRDLAWHGTIGHARDWLALSMLSDEAGEGVRSFLERRTKPD